MTASSTIRSRLESSGDGISLNVLMTSKDGQVLCERIEPQPAAHRQFETTLRVDCSPPRVDPRPNPIDLAGLELEPARGPQPEIHPLGDAALVGELLASRLRIASLLEPPHPLRVRRHVPPPPRETVELVRRWSYTGVRRSGPVSRVVPRVPSGPAEVRHLVVIEPVSGEELVRQQVLRLVSLLRRLLRFPALPPARQGRVRLD